MSGKKDAAEDAVVTKVEVSDFKEVPKVETNVTLKRGEVLIAELDESGKETGTFVTNLHSAETYFKDEKKFLIKKKG